MNRVFLYLLPQLKKIRDNFVEELILASQGKKTSLGFIRNPLPNHSIVRDDEIFQIFVIGGSVLKISLIKKNSQIISLKEVKIALIKNKESFFAIINKYLDKQVSVVAINFAFGLKPQLRNGVLDGKRHSIIASKGHQFKGLTNKFIGEELEKHIQIKFNRKITVSVANDTICLLLSSERSSHRYLLAAGIVGTGTNFAFFLDDQTAVNLESGNFDKFHQTTTGKIVDKNSTNPGRHLFEKEVSGAYLYQHYNLLINRTEKSRRLFSAFELSQQAQLHLRGVNWGVTIARKLIERSASLIACQIAGIYQFKRQTFDNRGLKLDKEARSSKLENLTSNLQPQNPASSLQHPTSRLSFIMEGSLFWRAWHYQELVKKYLEKLGLEKDSIQFIKIKNSGIIGASRLVTG